MRDSSFVVLPKGYDWKKYHYSYKEHFCKNRIGITKRGEGVGTILTAPNPLLHKRGKKLTGHLCDCDLKAKPPDGHRIWCVGNAGYW